MDCDKKFVPQVKEAMNPTLVGMPKPEEDDSVLHSLELLIYNDVMLNSDVQLGRSSSSIMSTRCRFLSTIKQPLSDSWLL
jgi:hypothetical protein